MCVIGHLGIIKAEEQQGSVFYLVTVKAVFQKKARFRPVRRFLIKISNSLQYRTSIK